MKKPGLLFALFALFALIAGPTSFASDEATESQVKRLPNLKVEDPVAQKPLVNADNSDLDAELQAILEAAEEEEHAED